MNFNKNKYFWSLFVGLIFMLGSTTTSYAQKDDKPVEDWELLEFEIVNGDTIYFSKLSEFTVKASRMLSLEEKRTYIKLKRNIIKVYPLAERAIALIDETERAIESIDKRRARKKYIKELENELKREFKDDLMKLSISQGRVLVKLIERDQGEPMFDILRRYKSPVSSFFWQNLGKRWGYDLREGYDPIIYSDLETIVRYIEDEGLNALIYERLAQRKSAQRKLKKGTNDPLTAPPPSKN